MCLPKRYFVVILVFIGFINYYYLRINLSMAIVEMTANKNVTIGNETKVQEAEFQWSTKEQGFVLGAFFYGTLFAPIGGILASKFGGATVYRCGLATTAVLTLLSPLIARSNFYLFFLIRVLVGISEVWASTGEIQLWSRWAPIAERSRLLSFCKTGVYIGTIISFLCSGIVMKIWHWSIVFYIPGIFTLIWFLFFLIFVSNDPSTDRFISEKERLYLIKSTTNPIRKTKLIYPWRSIFGSKHIWAVLMVYFTGYCEQVMTTTCLPIYLKDVVINISIDKIGFVSSIPHVIAIFSLPPVGYLADFLRVRKILNPTQLHKVYICGCSITIAIIFFLIGKVSNLLAIVIFLSLYKFASCFKEVCTRVIFLDMAPQYSGFLTGMGYIIASIGGILTTNYIGFTIKNHNQSEWNLCFTTVSVIFVISALTFYFYGSAKLQSWAISPKDDFDEESKRQSTVRMPIVRS